MPHTHSRPDDVPCAHQRTPQYHARYPLDFETRHTTRRRETVERRSLSAIPQATAFEMAEALLVTSVKLNFGFAKGYLPPDDALYLRSPEFELPEPIA